MAYLQPVDTDPRVEIQHMEKPSETEKAEIPQIDLTDTEQPDTPDKNSDDSETISNFSSAQQHT